MEKNLNTSIGLIFGHEGGYVNHPKDPGGPTKYGITQRTLKAWRGKAVSVADVQALTLDEAASILRRQYWQPVAGDELPAGLDHAVFDFSTNSGPSKAVKELQRILGVQADGTIGAHTLEAVASRDVNALIDALCDARLAFMQTLKTWPTFKTGWKKRVARVRTEAKSLAKGGRKLVCAVDLCGFEQANPESIKVLATDQGKATVGAGLGAVGIAASTAADKLAPYADAPVLKWVFLGLTGIGIGIGAYIAIRSIWSGEAAEAAT